MKRNSSPLWWLIPILIAALVLSGCERPLQPEVTIDAPPTVESEPVAPPTDTGQPADEPTQAPGDGYPGPQDDGGEGEPAGDGEGEPAPTTEPAPTESTDGQTGQVIYTVVAGDTLGEIAEAYGISVEALADANDLTDINTLEVGQQLIIPGGEGAPADTGDGEGEGEPAGERVHIVQAGENLYRIGLRYGFSVEELTVYNDLANPNRLEVGQEILIPPDGWTPE